MALHSEILGTLSIAASGSDSPALVLAGRGQGMLRHMIVCCPSAFTGTITLQIDPNDEAQTWYDLDGVTLTAGKAIVVPYMAGESLRFHSTGVEAAQRDFVLLGQFDDS